MRVLLRTNYKWVDAKLDINCNKIIATDGGWVINLNDIVSIENHDRKKYVKCNGCGEIIRKNARAITEHQNKSSTSKTCFNCPYLSVREEIVQNIKYSLNEDGTYYKSTKTQCKLRCTRRSYSSGPDINSEDARTGCFYSRCIEKGYEPLEDIFTRYPAVFDTIATIDTLDKKKWRLDEISSDVLVYKFRKKGANLKVLAVNGIIDRFVINGHAFAYSAKYNQIFFFTSEEYDTYFAYDVRALKDDLLNICQEIYKEAK